MNIIRLTGADEAFAATVGPYIGSAALAEELDAIVADRPGKAWSVALDGGTCVGFCGAVDGDPVEIETFWVDPAARGRGIGRLLLADALSAYPGRQVHAWCSAASRPLFAEAGFRVLQVGVNNGHWWAEVSRVRWTSRTDGCPPRRSTGP